MWQERKHYSDDDFLPRATFSSHIFTAALCGSSSPRVWVCGTMLLPYDWLCTCACECVCVWMCVEQQTVYYLPQFFIIIICALLHSPHIHYHSHPSLQQRRVELSGGKGMAVEQQRVALSSLKIHVHHDVHHVHHDDDGDDDDALRSKLNLDSFFSSPLFSSSVFPYLRVFPKILNLSLFLLAFVQFLDYFCFSTIPLWSTLEHSYICAHIKNTHKITVVHKNVQVSLWNVI